MKFYRKSKECVSPFNQDEVMIREEFEGFETVKCPIPMPDRDDFIKRRHTAKYRRAALCLSGGGIRSATFSLGVLQGLAKYRDLAKFDFLSTVSGGGFIGSWLSRWAWEESKEKTETQPTPIDRVSDQLATDTPEPDAIKRLRAYSSYLAPKRGLSKDKFTLLSIFSRNLFITWLVLLPILAAVLTLPKLYMLLLNNTQTLSGFSKLLHHPYWIAAFCGVCLFLNMVNLDFLPQDKVSTLKERFSLIRLFSAKLSNGLIVLLAVITSLSSPLYDWALYAFDFTGFSNNENYRLMAFSIFSVPLLLLLVTFVSGLAQGLLSGGMDEIHREKSASRNGILLLIASYWLALFAFVHVTPLLVFYVISLSPVIVAALGGLAGLSSIVFSYFSSVDAEREERKGFLSWVAGNLQTAGSLLVLVVLCFALLTTLSSVYVSYKGVDQSKNSNEQILADTSLLSCRPSPIEVEKAKAEAEEKGAKVKKIGCSASSLFLLRLESNYKHFISERSLPNFRDTFIIILGLVAISTIVSFAAGVNRFSLHALYGNRLVRSYLAAPRKSHDRNPDAETDFAVDDNIGLAELKGIKPLHILNGTINDSRSNDLATQHRKGGSFTFSAFHTGSSLTQFRDTSLLTKQGISLGKAMTISGAAVSPSMGHHTSALVSAVLTFLNARLGWWLPSPSALKERVLKSNEPLFGLYHLLKEFFSSTQSDSSYVHVSDGGHFDNLGLYEMVRRRCHTIVVVDAGQDPNFEYVDLSNVLRKIRVDFGIEILFEASHSPSIGKKPQSPVFKARIRYSEVDHEAIGSKRKNTDGTLIYIKPALYDNLPLDLKDYAKRSGSSSNPGFPHDSTVDQFFDESQFESYRRLGLLSCQSIGSSVFRVDRPEIEHLQAFNIQLNEGVAEDEKGNPAPVATPPNLDTLAKVFGDASSWAPPVLASAVTATTLVATVTLAKPDWAIPLQTPEKALRFSMPQHCKEVLSDVLSSDGEPIKKYQCGSVALEELTVPINEYDLKTLRSGVEIKLRDIQKELDKAEIPVSVRLDDECLKPSANEAKCNELSVLGKLELDNKHQNLIQSNTERAETLMEKLEYLSAESDWQGLKLDLSDLKTTEIKLDSNQVTQVNTLINLIDGAADNNVFKAIQKSTEKSAEELDSINQSLTNGFTELGSDAAQGEK